MSSCAEADVVRIVTDLAVELRPGDFVILEGPVGVGKTTFARYLLRALNVLQPSEGSPSFSIVHEYQSTRGGVVHIDFYRLQSESEIDDAGLPAYFWEKQVIVITEWLSLWPEFEETVYSRSSGRNIFKIVLDFPDSSQSSVHILRDIQIYQKI